MRTNLTEAEATFAANFAGMIRAQMVELLLQPGMDYAILTAQPDGKPGQMIRVTIEMLADPRTIPNLEKAAIDGDDEWEEYEDEFEELD